MRGPVQRRAISPLCHCRSYEAEVANTHERDVAECSLVKRCLCVSVVHKVFYLTKVHFGFRKMTREVFLFFDLAFHSGPTLRSLWFLFDTLPVSAPDLVTRRNHKAVKSITASGTHGNPHEREETSVSGIRSMM